MTPLTHQEQTRVEYWQTSPSHIEQAVSRFTPISLNEVGKAALLNRLETKYVVSVAMLPTLLAALCDDYNVLSIKGKQLNRYRNLYFDSADFTLYHRHHAGASMRYKVRSRQYVETGKNFLEIKQKDNKRKTRKQRFATDQFLRVIDPRSGDFLRHHYPYSVDLLYGRLQTTYSRITLVSRHTAERVTLDLDLRFEWDGRSVTLPHIAVIEVKRDSHAADSLAVAQLRRHHLRPQRFSKYCIGVSLIYPKVKHNNFKPTLRLVNKLSQGAAHAFQQ